MDLILPHEKIKGKYTIIAVKHAGSIVLSDCSIPSKDILTFQKFSLHLSHVISFSLFVFIFFVIENKF
jgi:hypothetical protein